MGVVALDPPLDDDLQDIADLTLSNKDVLQFFTGGTRYSGTQPSALGITATDAAAERTLATRAADYVLLRDEFLVIDADYSNAWTRALARATVTGAEIRVSASVDAYTSDVVQITSPNIKIVIEPGAMVKLKDSATLFTPVLHSQQALAVFFIGIGASNTQIIGGGTVDFNRNGQSKSDYNTAGGGGGRRYHGIFVSAYNAAAGGGTLTGVRVCVKVINSADAGIQCWHADGIDVSGSRVETSGAGAVFWGCQKVKSDNVGLIEIDNDGWRCFQHALDYFGCTNVESSGLRIIDQTSSTSSATSSGLSTFFSGITIGACRDVQMSDFQIIAKQDTNCIIPLGLSVVGCRNAHFSVGKITRYAQCSIEDGGNDNCTFTDIDCDGGLDSSDAFFKQTIGSTITGGIVIHDGFKYTDTSANGIAGHSLNSPSRGSYYKNVRSRRQLGRGFVVWSGVEVTLDGCEASACLDGLYIHKPNNNTAFPSSTDIGARRITAINCKFNYNERYAITPEYGDEVNVIDCEMINNGQSVGLGRRNGGAAVTTGAGYFGPATATGIVARSKWRFKRPRAYDDQTRTSDLGSADPGTPNKIRLYPISKYKVGQTIICKGCGVAGADLTARINDIDFQVVTLDRSLSTWPLRSPAPSGTISSSGTTITGSGTNFDPDLAVFGQFIKADGEYREVVKVNSDTSAQVISAFTSPLSSDSYDVVEFLVDQVPCQDYGFSLDPLDESFQIDEPDWGPGNQTANILDNSAAATALTVTTRFQAIVLGSAAWDSNAGSPAVTSFGGARYNGWALDDSAAAEQLTTELWIPDYAPRTWSAVVEWVNSGAGSGDVMWRLDSRSFAAGETMSGYTATMSTAGTAGAQDVLTRTVLGNVTVTPGLSLYLRLSRLGSNAGDTLTGDAIFSLLRLEPA